MKPNCPVLMVTRNEKSAKYSHLYRGVYPFIFPEPKFTDPNMWQADVDRRTHWVMKEATALGLLQKGDCVIAVQGWTSGLGHTNTIRVIEVE